MKLRTNHSLISLAIVLLGTLSIVAADFAQCVPGWEWSYNSKGQNPCQIAGSLQAPCLGFALYELGPLSNGSNYAAPQRNDTSAKNCGCNTVIYSLYTACAQCQSNTSNTPVTWSFWSQYCDSVYVTQYPNSIPFNASVPHWAYLNATNPGFNRTLAQAAGKDPEATPTSPPTISVSSTSLPVGTDLPMSITGTGGSPYSSSTPVGGIGGNHKPNIAVIAGGVVGGIVVLGALIVFFFFLKRRRASDKDHILGQYQMGYNHTHDQQIFGTPKLYHPSDPSTYPSPESGGSLNSGGYTTNPHQPGKYNGAAEL